MFFLDCLIVITAFISTSIVAYMLNSEPVQWGAVLRSSFLHLIPCAVVFKLFRTYSGIIRYSSFVDLKRIAYAMISAGAINYILQLAVGTLPGLLFERFDITFTLSVTLVSILLMWTLRILVKQLYEEVFRTEKARNVLIYGIMDGGIGLAKNIKNEKPARFKLKGFISHDPSLKYTLLLGEKVYQADEKLTNVLKQQGIQAVLISPARNEAFRNDMKLQDYIINAGVKIYMVRPAEEWQGNDGEQENMQVTALHEISIEDLLHRQKITIDIESVGKELDGKIILITGSAGSIGSEIVRQVASYNPKELILIDQAETPQHDIQMMLSKKWPEIKSRVIVTSITYQNRMENIFKAIKPDYVFHAAAYKHVPMMENNPSESVINNVYGTKVIADLSVKYGVKKFVMISTDKAVNPTNVMGCSKRICEIYVQSLDKAIKDGQVEGITQFVTTRFGNVLGSNGSVIPTFEQQIKAGGPVTVTDPNIIRFFMLISEACTLVLAAGTKGKGGEIFIFDMGEPVKIVDLARKMIRLSGAKDVRIEFTGLREGEKLYEEVLNDLEITHPSFHEKIRIAQVRQYDYAVVPKEIDKLISCAYTCQPMEIVSMMKDLVPEYKSNNSKYSVLDKNTVPEA